MNPTTGSVGDDDARATLYALPPAAPPAHLGALARVRACLLDPAFPATCRIWMDMELPRLIVLTCVLGASLLLVYMRGGPVHVHQPMTSTPVMNTLPPAVAPPAPSAVPTQRPATAAIHDVKAAHRRHRKRRH